MSTDLDLRPGKRTTYYSGRSLARARLDGAVELADAVWQLATAGRVDLAQIRRADGGFDYVAIGRNRIDRQPVSPATVTPNYRKKLAA